MANILVKISTIPGESTLTDYTGQIDCTSMRHAVDLPVVSRGTTRTEGASRHGAIELTHAIDKATPGLRLAASAGTNLGQVLIHRMRTIAGASKLVEKITINNAYVVRIDVDTGVENGAPVDEAMEHFSLEYSDVKWEHTHYVNGVKNSTVTGAWSTATQSTNV